MESLVPVWALKDLKLQYISIDILLVIVIECGIRMVLPTTRGLAVWKLLLFQMTLYVVLIVCIFSLHHIPYLLLLCVGLMCARLVTQSNSCKRARNVSKKLKFADINSHWTVSNHTGSQMHSLSAHDTSHQPLTVASDQAPSRQNSPSHSSHVHSMPFHFVQPRSPLSSFSSRTKPSLRQPLTSATPTPLQSSRHSDVISLHSSPNTSIITQFQRQAMHSTPPYSQPLTHHSPSQLSYSVPSSTSSSTSRGPPGLLNNGNTCFLNSVIQCLVWSEFPMENILTQVIGSKLLGEPQKKLVTALLAVSQQCRQWKTKPVIMRELLNAVSSLAPHLVQPRQGLSLMGYQSQQDAAEFLLWLLDTLHSVSGSSVQDDTSREQTAETLKHKQTLMKKIAVMNTDDVRYCNTLLEDLTHADSQLNKINNNSPVHEICHGQIVEARNCRKCMKTTVNIEYFAILPLPIPTTQAHDLSLCFERFVDLERLSDMFHCSCPPPSPQSNNTFTSDNPSSRVRLALFSQLPERLILQLTRFTYNSIKQVAVKNQTCIRFPVRGLDLTPFTVSGKLGLGTSSGHCVYDLTGFCVHTGAHSTSHGHYIAYCRTGSDKWYCFNDDYVHEIKNIQAEVNKSDILQNAYLLFYCLRT